MALKWTGQSKGALANSADSQPKFSLQRLGQAIGLCSVVGATALLSPAALALKTDFGMEYRATAFANQSDVFQTAAPGATDNDNGFAQLIRVKGNFLDEKTGISVYTSVELAGDRWVGDKHGDAPTSPSFDGVGNNNQNVRLDLGYLQVPVGHTIFRIGRQAASFNNCFLVCDDRRDRILMIQPFSKTTTMVAGYDRRQDSTAYANRDNGDQIYTGIISKLAGWDAALLYVKWTNNYDGTIAVPTTPYALQDVDMFSGYLSGDLSVVKTTVGFNWESDGNVTGATDDQYFVNDSLAAYLRLEGNAGPLGLGLQYITARDGGLISNGFDTYSSLINNNPDATQNASSMYRMGGSLGVKDFDEDLVIGKASFNVTPKFSVTGAVGQLSIDNGSNSDDSMVYDLQFAYQMNKGVKTWLSLGMLEKNDVGVLSGNSLTGQPTAFAKDDVKAASLNLSIDI